MLNATTSSIPRQIFTPSDHEPLNEEGSIGDTVDGEHSICFLLGPSSEELAVELIGDLNRDSHPKWELECKLIQPKTSKNEAQAFNNFKINTRYSKAG